MWQNFEISSVLTNVYFFFRPIWDLQNQKLFEKDAIENNKRQCHDLIFFCSRPTDLGHHEIKEGDTSYHGQLELFRTGLLLWFPNSSIVWFEDASLHTSTWGKNWKLLFDFYIKSTENFCLIFIQNPHLQNWTSTIAIQFEIKTKTLSLLFFCDLMKSTLQYKET